MSNKTQLQTNNTQLASLIQTLQGKATGGGSSGGGTTLTTGNFTVTSSMFEPGLDEVTLTSDALAASSRRVIVILHEKRLAVANVLYRSTISDNWVMVIGGEGTTFSIQSYIVSENSITVYGTVVPGTYSFITA